ncbi:hypothetical protein AF72_05225 [Xylella taiwanensis]|uniref:Uncharacterized protein n=1 Tax=Xylella taiwanensis TaxID=1444770 RepID=Z9JJ98_9GAMM|nr:hypothetical protein AB672_02540 [Xylella taiwanensis]EWS78475.1 hypothetical protein AF72_05225 [Xylella taiwanensis]
MTLSVIQKVYLLQINQQSEIYLGNRLEKSVYRQATRSNMLSNISAQDISNRIHRFQTFGIQA